MAALRAPADRAARLVGAQMLEAHVWATRRLDDAAHAAFDGARYDEATRLASEASARYEEATLVATALAPARDRRDNAVDLFAETYAPEDLQTGDSAVREALAALDGGSGGAAVAAAMRALAAYKQAESKAMAALQQVAEEQAEHTDLPWSPTDRSVREYLADLERAARGSGPALPNPDGSNGEARVAVSTARSILDAIARARAGVVAIETSLWVAVRDVDGPDREVAPQESVDLELDMGQAWTGTAFLYARGPFMHVVTAKALLFPQRFEPLLAGLASLLAEQGRLVRARHSAWDPSTERWLAGPERGSLTLGMVAPDVMQTDEVEVVTESGIGPLKGRLVRLQDRRRSPLGSLVITEVRHPAALVAAEHPPQPGQVVVAVGVIRTERGTFATSAMHGPVGASVDALREVRTTYRAPHALVGAPVVDLDARVVGVVIEVETDRFLFAPIQEVDRLIDAWWPPWLEPWPPWFELR